MSDLQQSSPRPIPSRTMTDVLALPDFERSLVNWIMRQNRATLSQCMEVFRQSADELQPVLVHLIDEGFLKQLDETEREGGVTPVYGPAMRTRRNRQMPQRIWDALA